MKKEVLLLLLVGSSSLLLRVDLAVAVADVVVIASNSRCSNELVPENLTVADD
jgi:hypothetical protein